MHSDLPQRSGLYDPRFEHDSCGVSFVANIKGDRSHSIVAMGLGAVCNLDHRGATGAEHDTGDGAGILVQIPDRFLRAVLPFALPPEGQYAVGLTFLPQDSVDAEKAQAAIEEIVSDERLTTLGWRDIPTNPTVRGKTALGVMPIIRQLLIGDPAGSQGIELDRKVYVVRKRIEHELPDVLRTYLPSLSARTLVYKGMFTTGQLGA